MNLRAALLALLALCLPAAAAPDTITPRVDHHQHLLSPMVIKLTTPVPKVVTVPPDLAAVLDAHAAHWNDKPGIAPLYADDAYVVSNIDAAPVQGADKVSAYISTRFRAGYRMKPTVFNTGATSAHVSGFFERGEGEGAKPFGYFDLSLAGNASVGWRIASEMIVFPGPADNEPETAQDLVALLDDAGIAKAVVLSDAYFFDSPRLTPDGGSYANVRAENDWTAAQVAQFPGRLVAFCSLNPLSSYAIAELKRCAASGHFKGLKLHFGVAGVDLLNPVHVAKVRAVVAEANRLKLPLVVHVRASDAYGAAHAKVLLDQIVSAAPDVSFTIAHFWGGEAYSAAALDVYAHAVSAHDPHTKNLYFDIAELNMVIGDNPEALKACAERMREIGLDRILYGTDGPVAESQTPRAGWAGTRAKLPLTEQEFRTLAGNVAPYLR